MEKRELPIRKIIYLDDERIVFDSPMGTFIGRTYQKPDQDPYSDNPVVFKCAKLSLEWRTY